MASSAAKLVSAGRLNRLWKNGVQAKMIAKTKVLKNMTEITANTSAENIASALAVKELNNKLVSNVSVRDGKLVITKGGADTVLNFSREAKAMIIEAMTDADNNYGLSNTAVKTIPGTVLAVFGDPTASGRVVNWSNGDRLVRSIINAVYWKDNKYVGNNHSGSGCSAVVSTDRKKVTLRNLFSVSVVAATVVYIPD